MAMLSLGIIRLNTSALPFMSGRLMAMLANSTTCLSSRMYLLPLKKMAHPSTASASLSDMVLALVLAYCTPLHEVLPKGFVGYLLKAQEVGVAGLDLGQDAVFPVFPVQRARRRVSVRLLRRVLVAEHVPRENLDRLER